MNYYTPILRWKAAERKALHTLSDEVRAMCKPVIELTPKSLEAKAFAKLPREFEEASQANCPYVDFQTSFGHIGEEFPTDKADNILRDMLSMEMGIIPVVRLDNSPQFISTVKQYQSMGRTGVCLRITTGDLRQEDAGSKIDEILNKISIDSAQTDLLIDAEFIQTSVPDLETLQRRVPYLSLWRTLIWAGGSFPRDLSEFSVGNHELPRLEWKAWQKLNLSGDSIPRVPRFADYTIQHPIYHVPPPIANVSASIRYTCPDHWLVMRGEGLMNKDGPKNEQYPAHAMMLCDLTEFSGAAFSAGDSYVARTAANPSKPGNPTTWLEACINHHVTMVTTQLRTLVET